jgi:hypothetical protein
MMISQLWIKRGGDNQRSAHVIDEDEPISPRRQNVRIEGETPERRGGVSGSDLGELAREANKHAEGLDADKQGDEDLDSQSKSRIAELVSKPGAIGGRRSSTLGSAGYRSPPSHTGGEAGSPDANVVRSIPNANNIPSKEA